MKFEIKNLKKKLTKGHSKGRRELINPLREWTTGLVVAIVLFLGGVLFTAFDFYSQYKSPPEVVVDVIPLEYRQSEVEYYANLYKEKEQTFNKLRSRSPVPHVSPVVTEKEDSNESTVEENQTLDEESLAEEPVDE